MYTKFLHFLPPTYVDEDIRSVVFRYQAMSGKLRIVEANKDLFNRVSNSNSAFPCNINYLVSRIRGESSYTLEGFIHNHTYLPLVEFFVDRLKYDEIDYYVKYGDVSSCRKIVNPGLTSFLSPRLMYCPSCLKDDYDKGETYIHRAHQINHVSSCNIHKELLLSHCPSCKTEFSIANQLEKPVCMVCKAKIQSNEVRASVASIEMAEDLDLLFNNSNSALKCFEKIKARCLLFGLEKGYVNLKGGHYNNKRIVSELLQRIEGVGLERKSIVELRDQKHLANIGINSGGVRVFFWMLIMRLFAGSVKDFLNAEVPSITSPIYFGNGPWICINKYCKGFNKSVIRKCRRHFCHTTKTFIGQFECLSCGGVYINRCNVKTVEMLEEYKVVKMGDIWKSGYLEDLLTKKVQSKRRW